MARPRLRTFFHCFFLGAILLIWILPTVAQRRESLPDQMDSLRQAVLQRASDSSISTLLKKTRNVTVVLTTVKGILDRGFDTFAISAELPRIEKNLHYADGNFTNNQRILTLRMLKITKSLLQTNGRRLKRWQEQLVDYSSQMVSVNHQLADIIRDSAGQSLFADSGLEASYRKQVLSFTNKWKRADSSNNANLQKIERLQSRVSNAYLQSEELLDECNFRINNYRNHLWSPEEPPLWEIAPGQYGEKFSDVLSASLKSTSGLVTFFLTERFRSLLLGLALLGGLMVLFSRASRQVRTREVPAETLEQFKTVYHHPLASAFLIFAAITPFFFEEEPTSFATAMWLAVALCYSWLYMKSGAIRFPRSWEILVLLFVFSNFFLVLTKSSFAERWLHLLLVGASLVLGYSLLRRIEILQKYLPRLSRSLLTLYLILCSGSLLANIYGSFALSKYLVSGALTGLLTARILFSVVELVMEGLGLCYESFKEKNELINSFEFYRLQPTLKKALNYILALVWLVILSKTLNFYDLLFESLRDFLMNKRQLGGNTFTFASILIFILVLWVSVLISRALLVIFGSDAPAGGGSRRTRWGSTLLLTRLGILLLGTVLAFVASGIPLDKLTLVVGALGVGIGFGLQNVVNNLVGGVILAFEKPIQVGDAVEVNNRFGTVRDIGIRSSRLETSDGSMVIIPNGDLLNQHLINWTLPNHHRRVELGVKIGLDQDLKKVQDLLRTAVLGLENVDRTPVVQVLADQFTDSAVQFRVLFWSDIDRWPQVKNEVLICVFSALKQAGIPIPNTSQDIYIRSEEGGQPPGP